MPAPIVTINNISTSKISRQSGKRVCNVQFTFDQPVQAYTVNVIGTAHDTGIVAHSEYRSVGVLASSTVSDIKLRTVDDIRQISAGVILTAEIDDMELYQEGANRVNIYGKATDGTWTPYEG